MLSECLAENTRMVPYALGHQINLDIRTSMLANVIKYANSAVLRRVRSGWLERPIKAMRNWPWQENLPVTSFQIV